VGTLVTMQRSILLLAPFIFLLLSTRCVSGDSQLGQIVTVNAPTSTLAGEPLTINVTVSFNVPSAGYGFIVSLMPSISTGSPYPTISESGSCIATVGDVSVCYFAPTWNQYQGTFTAAFTLNAPSKVGSWRPLVILSINSHVLDYKAIPITIT